MNNVTLEPYENGLQAFVVKDGEETMGEMVMSVSEGIMTVYHTEVFPKGEGKGLSKLLLSAMADYARRYGLKVVPLCVFVLGQFKRHPELYKDIWEKKLA